MNFGENLKRIREDKNLSQQELAGKLEVAQSTIAMWEASRRTPKLGELARLAMVLNITVNRLLGQPKDRKLEIIKNEIYVDGEAVHHQTPWVISGIPPGKHEISLVREGFSIDGGPQTVVVKAGQQVSISFKLKKK